MNIPKKCKWFEIWIDSIDNDNFIRKTHYPVEGLQLCVLEGEIFGLKVHKSIIVDGYLLACSKEHAKKRIYKKFSRLYGNTKWPDLLDRILKEL